MRLSRLWPLAILPLGLVGCTGSSSPSPAGGRSATQWTEEGNAALAGGDLKQALADFDAALDAQADSAQVRERRATVYLQMKKFDKAQADCDEALRIDSKLASAYFTRALAEKGLGDAERALEDFDKALDNGFEQSKVLAVRGALYYSTAKAGVRPDEAARILEKALKDFDRAVKLDPRQTGPRLQRAVVELDMGDYESAVADATAVLDAAPDSAVAYVARARGECELSETDRAINDCDAAIRLDKDQIEAYVVRAKTRLEKSSKMRTLAEVAECGQAADDCRKAMELCNRPQDDADALKRTRTLRGQAHELRGAIYHELRAAEKALAEYERALSLDPYLVSAMLRRALTRSVAGDSAGALDDCNMAISIDSARPEAYSGRGYLYNMAHDYSKAIEDFTQAVSLDPKCAKAYAGRAMVRSIMAQAELEKAKKAADQAEYNSCQEKARELRQKCIDDATKAIEANRHLTSAYLTRGLVFAKLQIADNARADFDAAIREDSKAVRAYYNRGVLSFNQRRVDAAIKDFQKAAELQPNDPLLDYRLFQCYQQKRDAILADKYRRKVQEKTNEIRQAPESFLMDSAADMPAKAKSPGALQPDIEADPLEMAKKELERKLDATAEKQGRA